MTEKKTTGNSFYYQELAQQFCDEAFTDKEALTYGACYWNNLNYVYNGKRYVMVEDKELNVILRQWLMKKKIPQNNRVIGNCVPIVQALIYKSNEKYSKLPFYVGKGQPNMRANNIIAYNNGLLDLNTYLAGKPALLSHTPLWVSSVCLPYDFDPSAKCLLWEQFLGQVFDGDKGQIGLLQEWFGYCLTHDTSLQRFMIWTGLPRAGKGTIWSVLSGIIGEEASGGFSLYQLAYQFGLYPLIGKLVAFCGEAELKGADKRGLILERIKGITGEDTFHIEYKQVSTFLDMVLPTRLIIACNELPSFYEVSGALSSRILLLQFNQSFVGREDFTLKDRLRGELSGISNWALQGLARLRANKGFTIPNDTQEAIRDYMEDNSPTLAFIKNYLIVENRLNIAYSNGVERSDKALTTTKGAIDKAYRQWCNDEGYEVMSPAYFWKKMKDTIRGLKCKEWERGDKKTYLGIALKGTMPTNTPANPQEEMSNAVFCEELEKALNK